MCIIVSIITIVASNIGNYDEHIGCHSKYKGIFEYWENIDSLFTYIDMTLCSNECPCNITSQMHNEFTSNNFSKEFINNIVDGGNATSFQDCPNDTIVKVKTFYEQDEKASKGKLNNLNMNNFVKYWKYIENKFNCVGWCANSYWYTGNFSNVYVNGGFCKYLFSGVNKGVPKYAGCLKEMFKFVKSKLQVCGYIALVCSCSMFITWIAGLVMCCKLRQNFVLVSEVEGNEENSKHNNNSKGKQKKKKFKRSDTKMSLNEEKNNVKKTKSKKHSTVTKNKCNKETIHFDTNDMDNNNNTQGNVPTVKTYTDLNTERKFKHNDLTHETSESIPKKTRKKIKKKK